MSHKLYNFHDQNWSFSVVLENFMIVHFNDLIISRELQLSGNEMQWRRRYRESGFVS